MIQLEKYYAFSAQDVEYIATDADGNCGCRYRVVVYLRSGRSFWVGYNAEYVRDKAMADLVAHIDNELNGTDRIWRRRRTGRERARICKEVQNEP